MSLDLVQQRRLASESGCELRFDPLSRQLYATDASIYQIEPLGVALPKSPREAASLLRAACAEEIPIIPRGAGTGLAGGAVGAGLVVDFSRYNRRISAFDPERRTVRVGSGVVLDRLNAFVRPAGLCFGPDVATSSRATLGGMIANNSSGARAPLYGTTIDHVISLDIVMTDGTLCTVGADHETLPEIHDAIDRMLREHASIVDAHFPPGLVKRWPGYGLDRWLRHSADLTKILGGSEGTLAAIVSAELRLSPLPETKSLGVLFFYSVTEAMEATVEILDLEPAAIEHVDSVLFDQTRGQLAFRRARSLLRLDDEPCEAFLIVEFYDDDGSRLRTLMDRNIGVRRQAFTDDADMEAIWSLRKAGLSLLTGCKGDAKPTAGIEDVAVTPAKLPAYVKGLQELMAPLKLSGSFYGHAASGLLHVRPVVDLHKAEDVAKYRRLADEVSALTKEVQGSIAGEHGVGIARTAYLREHLGPELTEVTSRIKDLFDPHHVMNPGKIVSDGRFAIDTHLRQGAGHRIPIPFEPVVVFAQKDRLFVGNLEQCNGCGGCRKDAVTMCPTYIATGEELMSTRGRANTIRAVLEGRLDGHAWPLLNADLEAALSSCLSCRACTVECPSNVNMALLKAELLHARQRVRGKRLRERVVGRADTIGAIASIAPGVSNALLRTRIVRTLAQRIAGLTTERPLPEYARRRFDRWFAARSGSPSGTRGKVVLWDDCFTRYNEPNVGQAAVQVLERAGFEVVLALGRACCGRPAFSVGSLDRAAALGKHNIDLLRGTYGSLPVVFLEPSCYSMFAEDYAELQVEGADDVATRASLFEAFVGDLLDEDSNALPLNGGDSQVAVHAHCHAKALVDAEVMAAAARRVPGAHVTLLDTGCCGMAGAFGASTEKYALSMQVAKPLAEKLDALPDGTKLVASGTSCRQQIRHVHGAEPMHMAEYLSSVLAAAEN